LTIEWCFVQQQKYQASSLVHLHLQSNIILNMRYVDCLDSRIAQVFGATLIGLACGIADNGLDPSTGERE